MLPELYILYDAKLWLVGKSVKVRFEQLKADLILVRKTGQERTFHSRKKECKQQKRLVCPRHAKGMMC